MEWWAWFLLGFALLVIEMFTPGGFYFMFFGMGALFVGAFDLLGINAPRWVQWVMFTAVSTGSLALLRRRFVERFRPSDGNVDEDQIAGTEAFAQSEITPGGFGQVTSRGSVWKARNVGDVPVAAGERCRVQQVNGLVLEVRPAADGKVVSLQGESQ